MTLQTNDDNLYFALSQRFHLEVPLLRKVKDKDGNEKEGYSPCIVLSQWEEQQCKVQAEKETLQMFEGKRPLATEASNWKTLYEDSYYGNIIYNAFRCPNDLDKKLFMNKKTILEEYSSHELSTHFMNYTTVVLNQPYMKHLVDKQRDPNAYSKLLDTIISHATETETAFFLSSYTTLSVSILARSLIEEVTALRKANGSSGSQ